MNPICGLDNRQQGTFFYMGLRNGVIYIVEKSALSYY